ncbi:GNAT family N-acetyltransferase [Candidatus Peregrinibacteria bacterium]|nr:GNAT family N-acetyltransferase [Candidatus Peregrinibacteria bacterium]
MHNLIKNLPQTPGVYKMKNKEGTVIYVGKAKSLRDRVRNYFRKDYEHSTRTRKLVENTADIEFIETGTELEALILENNLIKELRPRYNILMKDDKSYVYIKIDMNEDFPRIWVVREKILEKEGLRPHPVKYFGPKLASSKVYETLRILKKLFPFRHCSLDIKWKDQRSKIKDQNEKEKRGNEKVANLAVSPDKTLIEVKNHVIDYPCLDYFIKRCPGPCIGAISPVEYKKVVQQIVDFLNRKTDELEKSLKAQMMEAAEKKLFEKAARLRDKLTLIQNITEKQRIIDLERQNTDVINFITDQDKVYFNVFMIRGGKLIGQENFILNALEIGKNADEQNFKKEALESFLPQYYEKAADIPKEILIPEESEHKQSLEMWLKEKTNEKVIILNPKRGEKNHLLELSFKNAESFAKQYRLKWLAEEQKSGAVKHLAEILNLLKPPKRIEGFDISHLNGKETVGSMVVFENGVSKNEHYRHFKLRTIEEKPDDYASMKKVLARRLKYLNKPIDARIKKASKKDIPLIQKWGREMKWQELYKKPDWQNFFMLKVKKETAGMVRFLELQKGIFAVEAMYITKKYRGQKLSYILLDKLINKIKDKKARIYISAQRHLINHYLEYGFIESREAPKIFKKRNNKKILAYYKEKKRPSDPSFTSKPDLIVVDGGKGQLSAALIVLKQFKLEIPIIALAKQFEEIYVPNEKAPILLEEGDEALKLLQRIRDESHRFAITFGRELHRKSIFQ